MQASIPENFLIREVAASGDLLIMRLDERAAITDDVDTIYTIEAILLTAKDFQFKRVRMENANIRRVGKFEFGKDWPRSGRSESDTSRKIENRKTSGKAGRFFCIKGRKMSK